MPEIDSEIATLDAAAKSAESTLYKVGIIAAKGAAMPTKVVHAAIGLMLGGAGTGAALLTIHATSFLLAGVPFGAILGMLASILISRDRLDHMNERVSEVTVKCWSMRDREIVRINQQLIEARDHGHIDPEFESRLTRELTHLSIASPRELQEYFGLRSNSRQYLPAIRRHSDQPTNDAIVPAISDQSQ